MRIYIWSKNFLTGYSSGIGVILANSEDEARAIGRAALTQELGNLDGHDEFNPAPDKVIELDRPVKIALIWGGD